MPKKSRFRKLVLSTGAYRIGEATEEFTAERLRQIAENGNKVLANGYRIPAPYAHQDLETGLMPSPVNMSNGGALVDAATGKPIGWRSDLNSGFVTAFEYGEIEDENGQKREGLIADFEVEGAEDDPSTPAGKLGKTIKDSSIGLWSKYTDAKGNEYGETPVHVAVVTNPVEANQPNFAPLEGSFAVAMSNGGILMAFPASGSKPTNPEGNAGPDQNSNATAPEDAGSQREEGDDQAEESTPISQLIALLHQNFGLVLPHDTTPANLVERLFIAASQKGTDGEDASAAPGSKAPAPQIPSAPIAMSTTANTAETKPDFASEILMSQLVSGYKQQLRQRAEKLVARAKVTKEWVDRNFTPRVDTIKMSAATLTDDQLETIRNGGFPRQSIEDVLEGLESTAGPDLTKEGEGQKLPKGSEVPGGNRLTDAGADANAEHAWWKNEAGEASQDEYTDADLFEAATS